MYVTDGQPCPRCTSADNTVVTIPNTATTPAMVVSADKPIQVKVETPTATQSLSSGSSGTSSSTSVVTASVPNMQPKFSAAITVQKPTGAPVSTPTTQTAPMAPQTEVVVGNQYADQLSKLHDMGFVNDDVLRPALEKHNGDLNATLNDIFDM